jgi:signal transduction histidine kinase/ActR/RegA family two-component response regulator
MPTIEALTERIAPVSQHTLGRDLFARFESDSDILVIPVVEDDRPVGLIERDSFLLKFGGPFGHASYANRTAAHVMDPEPAVIEAGVDIDAFSDVFLSSRPGDLMRGFIVTRNGRYHGVGTALSLVQAVNDQQRRMNAELAARVATLSDDHAQSLMIARSRNRFLDLLGHKLRTPLNGVLAVAELLRRQPLNAQTQAHVNTIVESSEAVLRTLQNAQDLSHAQAGELHLLPAPTPLRVLMDDIQSYWIAHNAGNQTNLMVSYEGDTDLTAVLDGSRLNQIFHTLIGNALEQARNGMIEASLKAVAADGIIRVEAFVRDDGPGLDEARLPGLFEPFASDEAAPAGFSLALCQQLVQAMGGRITAANNPGRGATFAFSIEARQADAEVIPEDAAAVMGGAARQIAPHILIVDDNATNRVVAQALCEMFGCTSVTVEDGVEAVEAVQQRAFDLILMDIKMPRMDGVQATQAIRALDGPVNATPIVALTANADPEDALRYVDSGMICVVEKPIKPERLRMAINMALEGRSTAVVDIAATRSAA